MLGAIIGDTVGSVYEFNNVRKKEFQLITKNSEPTDDSIMTLAVAECIQKRYHNNPEMIVKTFKKWGRSYPNCGYGGRFYDWLFSNKTSAYGSFGNGAAMRISPVGWYAKNEKEVKELSKAFTEVTHNHPEGLKGAEVTAMCIYYAKIGKSKEFIKEYVSKYYSLDFDYEDLRENYHFNETCQESVPQAIYCFLISDSFEDCLRTTISIGGDCDTTSAISCAIAEAYYKDIRNDLIEHVLNTLPEPTNDCNPMAIINEFRGYQAYHNVSCEEIYEDTRVIGVEEIYNNNKYLELSFSKSLKALGEDLVYYHLDRIIGVEEDELLNDLYEERKIYEYLSYLEYYQSQNTIYNHSDLIFNICSNLLDSNVRMEEFKCYIKELNKILNQYNYNTKIIVFDNVHDAIKYIGEEYKIYKDTLKESYCIKL